MLADSPKMCKIIVSVPINDFSEYIVCKSCTPAYVQFLVEMLGVYG